MPYAADQAIALLSQVIPGMSKYTGTSAGTFINKPIPEHPAPGREADYSSTAKSYCQFLSNNRYPVDCTPPTCDPAHSCIKFNGERIVCSPPDMFGDCPK